MSTAFAFLGNIWNSITCCMKSHTTLNRVLESPLLQKPSKLPIQLHPLNTEGQLLTYSCLCHCDEYAILCKTSVITTWGLTSEINFNDKILELIVLPVKQNRQSQHFGSVCLEVHHSGGTSLMKIPLQVVFSGGG